MVRTRIESRLRMVTESYLVGAIVPAGVAYGFARLVSVTPAILDDWFIVAWYAAIGAAVTAVGVRRPTSPGALLNGGLLGWTSAVLVYRWQIGFGRVSLTVLALVMGAVPIIVGSWLAYESRRRRGVAEEPPVGTWRHVFPLVLLGLFAGSMPWLW